MANENSELKEKLNNSGKPQDSSKIASEITEKNQEISLLRSQCNSLSEENSELRQEIEIQSKRHTSEIKSLSKLLENTKMRLRDLERDKEEIENDLDALVTANNKFSTPKKDSEGNSGKKAGEEKGKLRGFNSYGRESSSLHSNTLRLNNPDKIIEEGKVTYDRFNNLMNELNAKNNLICELNSQIYSQKLQILELEQKIFTTSDRVQTQPLPEEEKSEDEIDISLQNYLSSKSIPVQFLKIGPGQYKIGSKKFNITLKDGRLAIRVGSGYMTIKEFLNIFVPNRKQSVPITHSTARETSSTSKKKEGKSARDFVASDIKRRIMWTDRHSMYD